LGGAGWTNRRVPAACFRKITIAVGNAEMRTRRHNGKRINRLPVANQLGG